MLAPWGIHSRNGPATPDEGMLPITTKHGHHNKAEGITCTASAISFMETPYEDDDELEEDDNGILVSPR